MEPLGSPILFAIDPFDAVRLPGVGESVEWQPVTGQIFRPDSLPPDKALAYDVFTTAGGTRRRLTRRSDPSGPFASSYFEQYRRVPKTVPELAALARRLIREAPP